MKTSDGTFLLSLEGIHLNSSNSSNLHLKKSSTDLFRNLSKVASPALLQLLPGGKANSADLVWFHYTG